MKINFLFFSIFIIFIHKINSLGIFRLPFKKRETHNKDKIMDIIKNEIVTEISIGSPGQKLPLLICVDTYSFYVADPTIMGEFSKFDSNKSSTYKLIQKNTYSIQPFYSGYHSKDTISFNNTNINDFIFVLADKLKYNSSGAIGLSPTHYHDSKISDCNIVEQLKKKGLTNNRVFTINYTSETEGEIIIGDYPSEYNRYYVKDDFLYMNAEMRSGDEFHWDLKFDGIYYKNLTNINYINYAELSTDIDIIIGSNKFKETLNKDFFARAVRNNECFSKSTYYNYDTLFYYYCNPNINISNLDDIVFKRKDWGNDIIFTPQELFKTIDNYKYFLIFFINNDRSFYRWKLGRLFLQKVKTIILDKERKIIGRYTMETNPEIKENELKNELKTKRRIWIIVIVLIVISIILAFYLNKLFTKMRRKKRLNEVIDDYDYTPVNA
jgi:hypothetical protein